MYKLNKLRVTRDNHINILNNKIIFPQIDIYLGRPIQGMVKKYKTTCVYIDHSTCYLPKSDRKITANQIIYNVFTGLGYREFNIYWIEQ